MKNLYIFSRVPDERKLEFLRKMVDKEDAIVFIQDGVYALLHHKLDLAQPIYILKSDVVARGIKTEATQITYAELVDLIFEYQRSITL